MSNLANSIDDGFCQFLLSCTLDICISKKEKSVNIHYLAACAIFLLVAPLSSGPGVVAFCVLFYDKKNVAWQQETCTRLKTYL